MSAHVLPSPGLVWGPYPEQRLAPEGDLLVGLRRLIGGVASRPTMPRRVARAIDSALARFAPLHAEQWAAQVTELRRTLSRHGMTPRLTGKALALAGIAMSRALGKTPYQTQYHAAWLILQNRLAEMATGEGKTLAAALAAAVAAMAGVPVHLVTANDYLVRRDCEGLQPFYASLGLSAACVLASMTPAERRSAYRSNVTYVTAKEVAFDYLRDHLTLKGERDPLVLRVRALNQDNPPLLAGLCMAILDEADSILLDEASVPLILSAPAAVSDEAMFRTIYAVASLDFHATEMT